MAIPFTIAVPDSTLRDLDERLARVRWPESLPGDPGHAVPMWPYL